MSRPGAGPSGRNRADHEGRCRFRESRGRPNRERFLSFIADVTTFNGGSAVGSPRARRRDEGVERLLRARWSDAVVDTDKGEVVGAGDLGYTTGRSILRGKGPDGKPSERRGEYLTVWRKQRDGTWKVIFDTGLDAAAALTRKASGNNAEQGNYGV